ncbi:MAG: glycine cleavage system protein T [marine actinobacterium MedAcidi-G3]|nr:MAG: glycine cleavage system protein T [marine actinobacterium MedAcidi-G3]MBA4812704.1 FAD-dependent oxidoreductase [Acidimicrobiales bacterium]OUW86849.1 MAG: glycine cleavage system protein T [Acidimicrobiaceae bacterium TMED224]HBQ04804.1 FAD-dependent oxidoreductase [Acidimicrobiaceae bacterium]
MSEFPKEAQCVVIGAGIVGNCLVSHLSDMGWKDIVLLDKGPLPNPGGSTGHASNFIFPVDHSKEIVDLTLESQRQYEEMGLQNTCGGIEVARTPERMEEFKRRMTSAKCWGIPSSLLTPSEVKEFVPFVSEDVILGGFYTPSVSAVDSLETGTQMRKKAQDAGHLAVFANTEVLDIETSAGRNKPRVTAVVTDKGRIECETVVIACGVWSPRIAEMAGATIPLTPAVHQMADVGPFDVLVETQQELAYPIVRDMDTFCYERQTAGSMEVGSYAHRPILHRVDEIPSNEEAALSPTEMPFTADDFDQQMEEAIELMEFLGDGEIKYAINGLLSLTPDANPVLGPTVEVENLWSAAAVWIKEGPGVGRLMAEWMTHGYPHVTDPHGADITRFYAQQRNVHHIEARAEEHFNKTYGIVHPREQWATRRGVTNGPVRARTDALGAFYFEAGGWERPHWYESNADLVEKYAIEGREHEWDGRWWTPISDAEHLHMRQHAALVDLSAFQIFEVAGPGVVSYIEKMVVNKCDLPVGSSIYTPVLNHSGGFRSDLTILRLASDRFRIITGAFDGGRDEYWFRQNLPGDGTVHFENRTNSICTLGVWGPRAVDLLSELTETDLSQTSFPYGSHQEVLIAGIPTEMFRVSYVGDAGFEVYTPMQHGLALWDAITDAGPPFDLRPVGAAVYGTSGRIEKGYRLMGSELEDEYTPLEAGLARPKVKAADFIGKDAYLEERKEEPCAQLCVLVMEDLTCDAGYERFPMGAGNEPILTADGSRIVDVKGRVSRVTTAGNAPSIGKYLLMAYLPSNLCELDTKLLVMYQNETYPVKVAASGANLALFDQSNERMKA